MLLFLFHIETGDDQIRSHNLCFNTVERVSYYKQKTCAFYECRAISYIFNWSFEFAQGSLLVLTR